MWLRTVVLTALAAAAGCTGSASPVRPVAPDFRDINVHNLEGTAVSLSSVLAGRATLVSFWAPWCEPCLHEQPELERLSRAAGACRGSVVGVAVGESSATVSAFVRDNQLTFPEFTDADFELADAMGQRRIPATVVFDAAARIVFTGSALADAAVDALTGVVPLRLDGARCDLRAR
jgi:thiol-disulfide isomerase/thioredoxin